MKALIVNAPGDIRLIDIDKPKLGAKDVLARVVYAGICGTDISILNGEIDFVRYPVRIGHEWSGIVEEVGEDVKNFKPGDRVVSDNGVSCGECEHCLNQEYGLCENGRSLGTINKAWDGCFAEYILMPFWHYHKIPDNITLEEAALLEPASIAWSGVKQCNITKESTVMVIGTGPIGLSAVAIAKYQGAKKVLLCGRKDFKLSIGMQMGADAIVNVINEDLKVFVSNETDGKGVDVVLETSGNIETIHQSLDSINSSGTIALIGFYERDLNGFNIDKLVMTRGKLLGILGEFGQMKETIDILDTGSFSLKPLITHRFKFDEAVDAFKTANEKNATKIKMLVEMGTEF